MIFTVNRCSDGTCTSSKFKYGCLLSSRAVYPGRSVPTLTWRFCQAPCMSYNISLWLQFTIFNVRFHNLPTFCSESSFISLVLLRWSENFLPFSEPEDSLLNSQNPVDGQMNAFHTLTPFPQIFLHFITCYVQVKCGLLIMKFLITCLHFSLSLCYFLCL